jgi:hypothetical protein
MDEQAKFVNVNQRKFGRLFSGTKKAPKTGAF